jgi:hypothetical protein
MLENIPTNPWNRPIGPRHIQYEDIKRLFDIIDAKQQEEAREIFAVLARQASETEDQFEARMTRVRNALVTLVTIGGANGETITEDDRTIFDSPMVPERIRSILIDTTNGPKVDQHHYEELAFAVSGFWSTARDQPRGFTVRTHVR